MPELKKAELNLKEKFLSRKFIMGAVSLAALLTFLPTGLLTGGEFLTGLGLVLGLYGTSNVGTKIALKK